MNLSKRISLLLAGLIAYLPATAGANEVCLYGSYYKELSTRVVSPMAELEVDLPGKSQLQVGYLVDQITSASAAAGRPEADQIFQEYRHEVSVGGNIELFDLMTPSLGLRYSGEPDYKSFGASGGLSFGLFDESTTLTARFGFLRDTITLRRRDDDRVEQLQPPPAQQGDFREYLSTGLVAVGLTQVLSSVLVAGLDLETQIALGYQENQYRREIHPRERYRFAISGWGAYRIEPSRTTIRVEYRLYADTWEMVAHSAELRVTQRIVPSLEIEPRIRFHIQNAVFFVDGAERDGKFYITMDPKLTAFNAQTFGLQLSWRLSVLEGTFLDLFSDVRIQPYYAFLRQTNRYGNAHIAQLGAFWPF